MTDFSVAKSRHTAYVGWIMKAMQPLTTRCLFPILTAAALSLGAEDKGWLVDFEKAKAQAAKEGKAILMEFTGSDWCPPCIALHKNVLTKDVFKENMPKNFILLKLDNPKDKSKQTPKEIEQYKKLSKEYAVRGVPTIFLVDETGKPFYKKVGFSSSQSAEEWVKEMSTKVEIPKALSEAKTAKGINRAKLLDKALELMGTTAAFADHKDKVDEIIQLDTKNEAGLKAKYEALAKTEGLKARLQKIADTCRGKKPEVAIAAYNKILKEKLVGEGLQEVLYFKSMVYYRKGDKTTARKLFIKSRKAAPRTPRAKEIGDILRNYYDPKRAT
tara:strand:+ start:297 stop:1283 length:987 start_codon:yes stop_codon:yes gene_type:complete